LTIEANVDCKRRVIVTCEQLRSAYCSLTSEGENQKSEIVRKMSKRCDLLVQVMLVTCTFLLDMSIP